jgi:hypothetical protein
MLQIKPYEPFHLHATATLWLASWRSTGVTLAEEVTYDDLAARIPVEVADQWSAFLAWEGDTLVGLLAMKPATSCLDQLFIPRKHRGAGSVSSSSTGRSGRCRTGFGCARSPRMPAPAASMNATASAIAKPSRTPA